MEDTRTLLSVEKEPLLQYGGQDYTELKKLVFLINKLSLSFSHHFERVPGKEMLLNSVSRSTKTTA